MLDPQPGLLLDFIPPSGRREVLVHFCLSPLSRPRRASDLALSGAFRNDPFSPPTIGLHHGAAVLGAPLLRKIRILVLFGSEHHALLVLSAGSLSTKLSPVISAVDTSPISGNLARGCHVPCRPAGVILALVTLHSRWDSPPLRLASGRAAPRLPSIWPARDPHQLAPGHAT